MISKEKEFVFSESVKAGKRIYYFDVKESRNGERFVSVTESKKIVDDANSQAQPTFEKHKIFLYKEDYDKFLAALSRVIQVAKGESPSIGEDDADADCGLTSTGNDSDLLSDEEIKIDVDF